GSSMESHALHGLGLYYEAGNKLWVNLYAPSTAEWKAVGVTLSMETDFPEGESATLHFTVATPKELTIALRRPYWAGTNFSVQVNGEPVSSFSILPSSFPPASSWFVELKRTWRTGDAVTVTLPTT